MIRLASRLKLTVLICGIFLITLPIAANAVVYFPSAAKSRGELLASDEQPSKKAPSLPETLIDKMTACSPSQPVVTPRTNKQILAQLALDQFGDDQDLNVLEEHLGKRSLQDRETFDTFFAQFWKKIPQPEKDSSGSWCIMTKKYEMLQMILKSDKSNQDWLSLASSIKRGFDSHLFGRDERIRQYGIDAAFAKNLMDKSFSAEQIKALGSVVFYTRSWEEKRRYSYGRFHSHEIWNTHRHHLLLCPDDDLYAFFESKTPDEIRRSGKIIADALNNLSSWAGYKANGYLGEYIAIAKLLLPLPPEGVKDVINAIGKNKNVYKRSEYRIRFVESKVKLWRQVHGIDEIESPAQVKSPDAPSPSVASKGHPLDSAKTTVTSKTSPKKKHMRRTEHSRRKTK